MAAVHETFYDPMVPLPYRVNKFQKETGDTFTMELLPVEKQSIGRFKAGQFNMMYVFGVGEVPISISGDPGEPEILTHTTRAVGVVTKAMNKLKAGMTIGIRGPYGTHWPVEEAYGDDIMIVAGGIGLAPLRPALYQVLQFREKFGKVILLYGTRTPEDILFKKELENWRKRFDMEVYVTVDRATGNWRGNVGVVTKLVPRAPFDPHNATAFVCGPEVMMRFTALSLIDRGMNSENIYVSMERNMKCGIGFCGHCQMGAPFICKDGPVFRLDQIRRQLEER
jgi:NAD(P)H-flavin reductase